MGALTLIVSWVAAALCAGALARVVGAVGVARVVVAAALAAALLAVVPGELCRALENLHASMLVSAALLVAAAVALTRLVRRAPAAEPLRFVVPHPIAWAVGAVGLACVADGALTRNFFDEDHHVPCAMVIARGVVPPVHPLVPGQVIPYHWGIDALYAQLAAAGFRPDTAIDVVTIACFALFFLAAALVGGALGGKRGATLSSIVVPLAGSPLAWPLHDGMGILQLSSPWPARFSVWDHRPPPITADFFQHPQGLAFPLVLVVLLLFTDDTKDASRRRLIGAFLFSLLSIVHAIHFLVLGFALGASTLLTALATRDLRALATKLGLLAAAAVLAVLFGGFFSPSASTPSTLDWARDFFGDPTLVGRVFHHVVVFGLPLLLLPFAARAGGPLRIALVAGATIGFLIPNLVVYRASWDIVKLDSAAAFLAGIALADTLARFLSKSPSPSSPSSPSSLPLSLARVGHASLSAAASTVPRVRLAVVALAVAATVAFPLAWMATRTVMQGRFDVPKKVDWRLRDDVLAVGRAVSSSIPPRARVLVSDPEMARMNGFLAPGFDPQRYAPYHMLDYAAARRFMSAHAVAVRNLDAASLQTLDVDYALLSTAEAARMSAALAAYAKVDVEAPGFSLYRLR